MRGNFYPPEGHDFVPTQHIRDLEEYNLKFSNIVFQGKLAEFRARTFDHLMSFNALGENSTLALFQLPSEYKKESSDFYYFSDILLITTKDEEDAPMSIRLIYNEKINQIGEKSSYLIEDLTLDYEDDCQYLLDSVLIDKGKMENTPNGPFHILQDGIIKFVEGTFMPFTNIQSLEDIDDEGEVIDEIYPFGTYENLFDKLFVLQKANFLLSKIVKRNPVALQIDGQVV